MTPVDVGNLLIIFIALMLFLVLIELGLIKLPSKRKILRPRKWEFWKLIFSDSGLETKIEWIDPNFNGRLFIKHKAWSQPIFVPLVNITRKTLFPDNGKLVYEIKGIGADGMKSFDSNYYKNKNLNEKQFWLLKEREQKSNAEKEDLKKAFQSVERSVFDGMNEEYAENIYSMEKKLLEKLLEEKTKAKKK
jgi:hypothetical protein